MWQWSQFIVKALFVCPHFGHLMIGLYFILFLDGELRAPTSESSMICPPPQVAGGLRARG